MRLHRFSLILTVDPDDEQADRLYAAVDDGTIATLSGVPQVHFHRQAGSLEEALRSAIKDVTAAGFGVARVEMTPDALLQAS